MSLLIDKSLWDLEHERHGISQLTHSSRQNPFPFIAYENGMPVAYGDTIVPTVRNNVGELVGVV